MAKAKILIVEDEIIVAEEIRSRLEGLGYVVSAMASSGEEAIQKAEETHPDLVLMDIKLPGDMDGVEAAAQIRDRFDIPVVYLTAYADEDTLQRAKIAEPFGYLVKPFQERELYGTMEMALYKHKMQKRARESQRWYSTIIESIDDGIITADARGLVICMNPIAEAWTDLKQKEATGKELAELFDIIDGKTGKVIENSVARALREGVSVGREDHLLITRDGREIAISDSASLIRDDKGNITDVVFTFSDITERKRAEEELKMSHEQLRALTVRLSEVEEAERQRLARELHDQVGQNLTALGINLNIVQAQMSGQEPDLIRARLGDSLALIEQTTKIIRNMMSDLRPEVLDDYGLMAALRWYTGQFYNRTHIAVSVCGEELVPRLPSVVETALFRITQEALTNVARHSQASKAAVTLKEVAGMVQLAITDNGIGFDLASLRQLREWPGWGLIIMEERATVIGGHLRVESRPGEGTRLTVEVRR